MPKTVTVKVGKKTLLGFYRLHKKQIIVTSSLGQRSAKLGSDDPEAKAKLLLAQIVSEVPIAAY